MRITPTGPSHEEDGFLVVPIPVGELWVEGASNLIPALGPEAVIAVEGMENEVEDIYEADSLYVVEPDYSAWGDV